MNNKSSTPGGESALSAAETMFSLVNAGHVIEKKIEEALDQVGLSGPKFGALTHMVQADAPLSLSDCAARMTCVRSNITQLVDRLEADGLVRRVEDPTDRRAVRAELTKLGRERQAAGALKMAAVQSEFALILAGIDHSALQKTLSAIN